MKLTKKLEAEILKLYHGYWDANLSGNIKSFGSNLDDNITVYGTAKTEVFTSKKEVVKFYTATADQMKDKADFRNRKIIAKAVGNTVVVNEQCDLYVLAGKTWMFYGHARGTAIFEQKGGSWKFANAHFSFPDSRADEGEQIATEKIKTENLQLREAVQRRTVELEHKNRELEIETALEKVRVVAMTMKEPAAMLDVCKTISLQLQSLGVKEIRNVQTAIFYESKGTYMNYEFYAKHKKTCITETGYTDHKIAKDFAKKMLQGKGEIYITHIKGKKVKEWIAYQKTTNVFIDRFLEKASSLNYYWHSLGPVALGISTYSPLREDDLKLFQRFLNVFELAYTRYLDIEKAEAQAKEVAIELGLERVRARAMAMQHSDELAELVATVFRELNELNFSLASCIIWIHDPSHKSNTLWIASEEMNKPARPLEVHPFYPDFFTSIITAWKAKDPQWIFSLAGTEKKKFEKSFFKEYPELPEALKIPVRDNKQIVFSASFNNFGALEIVATEPLTNEKFEILHRFGNVFNTSYTRFNDLKKAEAQAREAQIEAALERVRSRSMAMHKSDELLEAGEILFSEMQKLGIESLTAGYVLLDEEGKNGSNYAPNPLTKKILPLPVIIPHNETVHMKRVVENWKKGNPFFIVEMDEAETIKHQTFIAERSTNFPLNAAQLIAISPAKLFLHNFYFKEGYLLIVGRNRLSVEQTDIMFRFTKVFQQTYTRFLDLQKAEAQTKEAQVEASLERVRSRAMAIRKSDELSEVIQIIFQELNKLGIDLMECSIATYDDTNPKDLIYWSAGPFGSAQSSSTKLQYIDHPLLIELLNDFGSRTQYRSGEYSGELLKTWWDRIFAETDFRYAPKDFIKSWKKIKKVFYSQAAMNHGFLEFLGKEPLPEDKVQILKRFTNVIDLTYTRYDDVVKAEAQAREAQIEAALERVRSRSIGMQKSEELREVIQVIHDQLIHLNFEIDAAGFTLDYHQNNDWNTWIANKSGSLPSLLFIPYIDHPQFNYYKSAKEKGLDFLANTLSFEEKNSIFNYMFKFMGDYPQAEKDELLGKPGLAISQAFLKNISLWIYNLDAIPYSEEDNSTLMRFAKVFEQTYTRFNDLQKAEAQAREAQIEAALERVRSRSMGMQKSEELKEVIKIVYEQLIQLKINLDHAGFVVDYKPKGDWTFWIADERDIPSKITHPYFESVWANQFKKAKEKGEDIFATHLNFEEKNKFYNDLLSHVPGIAEASKDFYLRCPALAATTVLLENVGLYIENFSGTPYTDEENATLMRFGKVFEQTYTRFLDLQKAEAQAREAQIELGLERVRARAMAMQKSDELSELVDTVFKELTKLDFALNWCIINIIDESTLSNTVWAANPDINEAPESYHMLFEDYPFHDAMMKGWKERNTKLVYVLEGEEKKVYDEYLFKDTEFRRVPAAAQAASRAMEKYVVTFTFSNFGGLQTVGEVPLSDANIDILSRFGKVFDLTYTRFNDLQKAEEQAREAQIQLALERVRARTMAMQKSDELPDAANLLFLQVQALGMPAWSAGYCTWDDDKKSSITLSMSSEGVLQPRLSMPLTEDPSLMHFREARERGESFFVEEVGGEELKRHYAYLRTLPGVKETLDDIEKAGFPVPTFQIFHLAYFTKGFLLFITYEPVPDAHDIFKRFASVFEQTYTRFLDLQKAEAQAREARIEGALERVRSRTMAMRRSEELADVATILFQQVKALGVPQWVCGFCIFEIDDKEFTWYHGGRDGDVLTPCQVPLTEHPVFIQMNESRKRGDELYVYEIAGEIQAGNYRYMQTIPCMRESLQHILDAGLSLPEFQINHLANFSHGNLIFISYEPFPEMHDVFKRFAKVFEQTYTRFLDLQKAEAQAREAQIELALERVRARAMAMQKSEELAEAAQLLYKEFGTLGINTISCGYMFIDEAKKIQTAWAVLPDGSLLPDFIIFPLTGDHVLDRRYKDWKEKMQLHTYEVEGEANKAHHRFLARYVPPFVVKEIFSKLPERIVFHCANFSQGYLFILAADFFREEDQQTIIRFAKVFDLTYTRFNDLKKAEAQARESQIQLAMERVRARTMAMQRSDELAEAASVLFKQIADLGTKQWSSGFDIWQADDISATAWMSNQDGSVARPFLVPYTQDPFFKQIYEARQSGKDFFVMESSGKELEETYQYMFTLPDAKKYFDAVTSSGFQIPIFQITHCIFFPQGFLMFITYEPVPDMWDIFKRFGKVFEQTYTRFLDLQKAEAQAREAKIEASLERTRTQSMIMQHSKELDDALRVFHEQVLLLSIHSAFSFLWLPDEEKDQHIFWAAWTEDQNNSIVFKSKAINYPLDRNEPATAQCFVDWKGNEPIVSYHVPPPGVGNYFAAWQELIYGAEQLKPEYFTGGLYYVEAFMKYGCFGVMVVNDLTEDEKKILGRFAIEFERTYTRFLDLQKAEAQAREAQIETALEKVRSRTMAMQQSNELGDVATVLFKEMNHLVKNLWSCGFVLCEKDRAEDEWWLSTESGFIPAFYLPNTGDRVHENLYTGWKNGEAYRTEQIEGEELELHYEWLMSIPVSKKIFDDFAAAGFERPTWQKLHSAYFSKGYLCIITREPCPEEEVFKRFAQVFDLTYTRFLDLQKAETQARESQIEAAMEKVRSRSLAMQKPEELTEVAELLRKEMGQLGVEELETSSIYIVDEENKQVECWYAIKDIREENKRLVSDEMTITFADTWVGSEMEKFYRSKKHKASIVMKGHNRKEWINYCAGKSKVLQGYYGDEIPERIYHLVKFNGGYMGAASPGDISAESWDLLRRASVVFSLAYTRFNDLQIAEAHAFQAEQDLIAITEAKQKAEEALTELQTTQKQLIQSEKMASLGELTAGIAHEIQNPLNFVNNFSEVSKELLDEMREAIEKGDTEEAKEIMNDVIQNLEKINHHGKRADGIVKGMLQHSSSGSGKNEPTDINVLADEYLRLAYHGLRAKEKSFNATMKTDFDEAIGNINIIPQDIGRVILNLITNAFYVVNEKSKQGIAGYEPTVEVSTKKEGNKVFVSVKDNGSGIPQKILDKIFQPFFTTKPTGQGTGLGLSLSYDIVKAHGGELMVETKEARPDDPVGRRVGSEFIIQLPYTN